MAKKMGMTAAKLAVPELAAVGPALKIAKKFNPFGKLYEEQYSNPTLHFMDPGQYHQM